MIIVLFKSTSSSITPAQGTSPEADSTPTQRKHVALGKRGKLDELPTSAERGFEYRSRNVR